MSTLIFHKLIKGLIFQYVLALYFFSQIVKNFTDHNCKHRPTDMPSLNILVPTAVGKTCISCEAMPTQMLPCSYSQAFSQDPRKYFKNIVQPRTIFI